MVHRGLFLRVPAVVGNAASYNTHSLFECLPPSRTCCEIRVPGLGARHCSSLFPSSPVMMAMLSSLVVRVSLALAPFSGSIITREARQRSRGVTNGRECLRTVLVG